MSDDRLTRRRFLQASLTASLTGVSLLALSPGLLTSVAHAHPLPTRKPRAPKLLMLDPGHGGRDPGAVGHRGTYEKDITLDIAQHMAAALSNKQGISVKLTRTRDVFIPLEERVRMGQEARADLFLSIHADSAPNRSARGLSVYTLSSKASDAFAKELADHENKADLMGGLDLPVADEEVTAILLDLATRQTRNTAQHARVRFIQAIGSKWHLLEQPMRAANFVVLRAPDVPSMLVETGFLSNPQDEKILRTTQHRKRIALLMAKNLATILSSSLFG
ncbi:MAG: N-acetylmuramoyl-L-alanine amidase [Alphaproteobacteria bacterium]|nr:N-acetylmuramoyl-L-alanine amidase [Alphaproteobacteria bacterium]